MTDLSWAVQKAIFDALTSAGVTVVDGVPQADVLPPVTVYFGDDPVQELGGKTDTLERHDFTIHVLTTGSSRKPMRDTQGQIKTALHDQPISFAGAVLSQPRLTTADGQQVDGSTFLGTQTFVILAQPAG